MKLKGVITATVLPFTGKGAIDWDSFASLLRFAVTPDGIAGCLVNGPAGEGTSLTSEERVEVIRFARAQLPGKALIAGVAAFSTADAVGEARRAREAGADAALLFPPPAFAGADQRTAVAFVRQVGRESALAIALFQPGLFSTQALAEIAHLPGVCAVAEGADPITAYEDNWRAIKASGAHVAVLAADPDRCLPQLAVGADGILSALACLAPGLFAELCVAAAGADLPAMRRAADRLYPLVRQVHGRAPRIDAGSRIKVALAHWGVIVDPRPRPPLLPIEPAVAADVIAAADTLER